MTVKLRHAGQVLIGQDVPDRALGKVRSVVNDLARDSVAVQASVATATASIATTQAALDVAEASLVTAQADIVTLDTRVDNIESGSTVVYAHPRRVALDSHDLYCWLLNESASPFANTGTAGTSNLVEAGTLYKQQSGLYADCLGFDGAAANHLEGGTFDFPTTFTCCGWTNFKTWRDLSRIFLKRHAATWVSPYAVFGLCGNADGALFVLMSTTAGARTLTLGLDEARLSQGTWCHIGATYDGTTLKVYCNGDLVGSAVYTDALDNGDSQPFYIGSRASGAGAGPISAKVSDVRICDVARDAAWFRNVYKLGVMYP